MTLPYEEGTWFAVPLRSGGYGVGVVARATKKGEVLLGYFFGPRRGAVPPLDDVSTMRPEDAVYVVRFGDLALIKGEWPIIGRSSAFDRRCWPMPSFVRRDELSGRAWQVEYAVDDPNEVVSETPISSGDAALERDAVLGAGAVELVLTKALNP